MRGEYVKTTLQIDTLVPSYIMQIEVAQWFKPRTTTTDDLGTKFVSNENTKVLIFTIKYAIFMGMMWYLIL